MSENPTQCPRLDYCSFYKTATCENLGKGCAHTTARRMALSYCARDGGWPNCVRKKMLEKGESPVVNMLPSGEFIVTEGGSTVIRCFDK